MDKRTSEALEKSIEKYRKALVNGYMQLGAPSCPLCGMFWSEMCTGCPVRDRTGHPACRKSPYRVVSNILDTWTDSHGGAWLIETQEQRDAVQAELDFLISLREVDNG